MTDRPVGLEPTSEALKKIKKKSAQLADMHGDMADLNQRWQNRLAYGTLLASVAMLALTFVSSQFIVRTTFFTADGFEWLKAFVAVINFSAGVTLSIWKPAEQEARHREAIAHYTQAIYAIRRLEDRGNVTHQEVAEVQADYLDDKGIPRIPSRRFLRLKQRYLIRACISSFVEQHPGAWIPWIKFRMWTTELCSRELPQPTHRG